MIDSPAIFAAVATIRLDLSPRALRSGGTASADVAERSRPSCSRCSSIRRFAITTSLVWYSEGMKRTASAQWRGDLKSGTGTISTASGVLSGTPYSFKTRFEDGKGTNPEELLAAAHAGCFTMALSAQLAGAGLTAESLETTCA